MLALSRIRASLLRERTILNKRLREILLEFGVVWSQMVHVVRRRMPALLEEADDGLPGLQREQLQEGCERLVALDERRTRYDRRLRQMVCGDLYCARLACVMGFGAVNVTALAAKLGDCQA